MKLKPQSHIYFMGIGGTGMTSVAGLCQQAGYQVSGSDAGIYPPTSEILAHLKIPVKTPYDVSNIKNTQPDCVVIANALSRGHAELEYVLENDIPHTSFPALMGELFLEKSTSIVVAGTHGKTTTTTMAAYILQQLDQDPGYLIGGAPKDLSSGFNIGRSMQGGFFCIEGDEYDTAFFDKNSKFLHYRPKYLILNNLEFDHADIFKDLDAIEKQFTKLIHLVKDPKNIIANMNDTGIASLLQKLGLEKQVTAVGPTAEHDVCIESSGFDGRSWQANVKTKHLGLLSFQTQMSGSHNIANFSQVIALLDRLVANQLLSADIATQLPATISAFQGVARRLDKLCERDGITVFEDFAHHPTSILKVLEGFKASQSRGRLLVAFEPRNATSRRNIFTEKFAQSLSIADQVLIGECPVDQRIKSDDRMNTKELEARIGSKARAFETNEQLLTHVQSSLETGDTIIFMSCGSFSGIQHKLTSHLCTKK